MKSKFVKEAIIIFLLLVVIVFAIGILFYDSITENVKDIASVQYVTSDATNEVLEQIEETSGESVKTSNKDSLLKSYSINADDLSGYASENYYESGKKDPFAETSETIDEYKTTTSSPGTATQSQTSNPLQNVTKENKVSNTVSNKTSNTTNTTNSVKLNTGNTVKNTVSTNKTNTVVNSVTKDKTESSSVGTFFEDKNSK